MKMPPSLLASALFLVPSWNWTLGADQAQFGSAWSRNMVSEERSLPESFDPKSGLNVRWVAQLGTESHATPVVAGGRVYIGTNNGEPRDPKQVGDRGVLMCFDEQSGHFLWQLIVPKREDDPYLDWPNSGLCSPVTVEGNRVYVVDNRGEVLCLDAKGMTDGNDGPYRDEGRHMALRGAPPLEPGPSDADILWLFDLTSGAGIWSHDAAHSSILIRGRYLYLNTGTGVDNTHKRIRTPNAPSLVVLDKWTGQFVARDEEHIAPRIFHSTWSAPSMGKIAGRDWIFFCGGDGIVYAFEPVEEKPEAPPRPANSSNDPEPVQPLKRVWRFDFDPSGPKENVHRYNSNRKEGPSNFYGMPVVDHGRLFVAGGGDIFWGKNEAWLKCLDPQKQGPAAQVWSYPLERHVLSTPAVWDGLVFVADCGRKLHCVDAQTGQPVWTQEVKGDVWASPLVADGKVYLGTRAGQFLILAAGREKKLLSVVELGDPISATAVAANGVLYVATMSHLYAIQTGARGTSNQSAGAMKSATAGIAR
jgi:outer membrane protein assembly factor BamB